MVGIQILFSSLIIVQAWSNLRILLEGGRLALEGDTLTHFVIGKIHIGTTL